MSRMFGSINRWADRNFIAVTSTSLVVLLLLFFSIDRIFITIPAGHSGALWLRFFGGTVIDTHYGEGTKIIFPWDKIYVYDTRVQQATDKFDVLTNEGLQIAIEVTLRFKMKPDAVGAITAFAGPDFVKSLVMPSVGATVRHESAKYSVEEIYTSRRSEVESDILASITRVVDHLIPSNLHEGAEIRILDFWFRSIQLPQELKSSIEGRMTQRQLAEQYVFILQREEREKQRKEIEAQGIKAFQDTVSSGISENYLRWKGIDATLKLADSPNSKIVIIGGKEGLPIILGPMENGVTLPPAKKVDDPRSGEATPAREGPSSIGRSALPAEPLALNPTLSMPPKSQ